jgi:hypothetical protein
VGMGQGCADLGVTTGIRGQRSGIRDQDFETGDAGSLFREQGIEEMIWGVRKAGGHGDCLTPDP